MHKEELIALSYRYKGEVDKIYKAIKRKEKVEPLSCKNCLTILDEDYPKELLDLEYPPVVLFYQGDLSLLRKQKIAVVGSRLPGDYARNITEKLCENTEMVVVSGLAKGVDACAHRFAVRSIGILGCGLDVVYPYENASLIEYMKQKQLVLSEYPPGTKPFGYHFPIRNRLIAALSKTIYVMEVKQRSGTMTTVEQALDLCRELKVLPFALNTDPLIYNNDLIEEGAGILLRSDIDKKI